MDKLSKIILNLKDAEDACDRLFEDMLHDFPESYDVMALRAQVQCCVLCQMLVHRPTHRVRPSAVRERDQARHSDGWSAG